MAVIHTATESGVNTAPLSCTFKFNTVWANVGAYVNAIKVPIPDKRIAKLSDRILGFFNISISNIGSDTVFRM
jgi:hypothetical protein